MRILISVLLLVIQLTGCTTLEDIHDVRSLPTRTRITSNNSFYYDPAVRAYRLRGEPSDADEMSKGRVLRDVLGKKIQSVEELARIMRANEKSIAATEEEVMAFTSTGAYLVVGIIYLSLVISLTVIHGVLNLPFVPVVTHLQTTYQHDAETMYFSGRGLFDAGEFHAALSEWQRALLLMPSLQAESDIDYWRGKAFESQLSYREALYAYNRFLGYSEQTIPPYFINSYPSDAGWESKATEVGRRIAQLANRPDSP